jgi:hypothetical protein
MSSLYEANIRAAVNRVNVENFDVLAQVLRAFEDKWKDEIVSAQSSEKVLKLQGRVQGLRDILSRMGRETR